MTNATFCFTFSAIVDGDVVAIAIQKCWGDTTAKLTALDDKIKSLVGSTNSELLLKNLGKCDGYALVFQKGKITFMSNLQNS